MAVRTNKKKSPPVLSHEFIRQNYGDITCIAFVILFGGSLVQFTAKYMNPLSRFSYTNTSEGGDSNDQTILYGNGIWDLMVVLTYSLLCTVMTCLANENICDKFIPRLQLSLKKAFQLRYIINYSVFYLFTTVIITLMWKDAVVQSNENFSIRSHLISLMNNHPEMFVSFYVKIFYTIALGFCVSMLMNLYFWNVRSKHYLAVTVDNGSSFLIYYLMQHYNCGTFGVYLIATFTIPRLLWSLKYISDEFNGKKYQPINLAISLLHMVAAVGGLTSAWTFIFFLIRNTNFTELNMHTIATSGTYILFAVISSVITSNNLKDTFGVVFKPSSSSAPPKKPSAPKKRTLKTNK